MACCLAFCAFKFFGILVLILALLKIYLKLTTKWCKSYTCLVGKTVIVTGANVGIGFETAADFAKRGAKVILACRNKVKCEAARDKIIKLTGNEKVVAKILDLSSFKSIRTFAQDINENEDRLDILVNNAGAGGIGDKLTEDGFQEEMQINYFGPFLLTNLLLGLLIKTGKSRIVNLSSLMAKYGKMNLEKITEFPGAVQIYALSKLCMTLFTTALAIKLVDTQVTSYAVHPGAVNTELTRRLPPILMVIKNVTFNFFAKNSMEGAQTTLHTALEPNIEKYNGEMFQECKVISPYQNAKDEQLALKLWKKSEELVKLAASERIENILIPNTDL